MLITCHYTSPAPDAKTAFTITTWNILHGRRLHGRVDLQGLIRSVQSLHADVIALQEVDRRMLRSGRKDQAARVAAATGMHHVFGRARRRFGGGSFGDALLSLHTMEHVVHLRLVRTGWRRERRVAVIADVVLDGVRWKVATAHLSLDGDESEAQLRQLLAYVDTTPGPVVVAGDLNRQPSEVHAVVGELGWTVIETGSTFRADNPQHTLDYVLTKRCSVVGYEVTALAVSDHCAVTVTLNAAP